jgi:uncharacterized protein YraI
VFARFLRVNVRSGPGVDFTPIGQITPGQGYRATGRSDEGNNWLRINFNGGGGWVAYFTVLVEGDAAILPIVEPAHPQQIVRQPEEILAQVFRTVNVRRDPTMQSDKIDQLFHGDEVPILGRDSAENDWLQVEIDGTTGWVAYFTVTVIGNVSRLKVVSQEPTPDASRLAASESTGVTAHAFREVNIRQGPGMQFDRIGQLTSGDEVDVTGRSDTGNNWLLIDFAGQSGWIAYFTVTIEGDPNTLPVVEPSS